MNPLEQGVLLMIAFFCGFVLGGIIGSDEK